MAAVMLFLRQTTGKTERHTHFCISLEPVFTRDCGGRVHFTDEPTGNLDSATSREVMELMQKVVREKQQTLIMVTHDNELAAFADRIFHIKDGKIIRIEEQANHLG